MQHAPISRARYVQENRKMRFQEAYDGSKHVDNWRNNTVYKKQASMNDTHSANSYGTQLAPTSARSVITR